jgi:tRNA(Ile2) C34 agmatinyltransferase TiaS
MENRESGLGSDGSKRRSIMIATEDDMPMSARPKCPVCGNNCAANGVSWRCKACGKAFVKYPQQKRNMHRPKCVECDSQNVISRGSYWNCKDCGRNWTKIKRREFKNVPKCIL